MFCSEGGIVNAWTAEEKVQIIFYLQHFILLH